MRSAGSRLLFWLLLLVALAGCSSSPAIVKGGVSTDSSLNPDSQGRASPVVIRLFELRSVAAFDSADFPSLYERESEALGADLVARDEMILQPGEQKKLERTLQADTKFVGVIAAFRDLDRAQWRASMAIKPEKKNKFFIKLEGNSLSLSAKKPKKK